MCAGEDAALLLPPCAPERSGGKKPASPPPPPLTPPLPAAHTHASFTRATGRSRTFCSSRGCPCTLTVHCSQWRGEAPLPQGRFCAPCRVRHSVAWGAVPHGGLSSSAGEKRRQALPRVLVAARARVTRLFLKSRGVCMSRGLAARGVVESSPAPEPIAPAPAAPASQPVSAVKLPLLPRARPCGSAVGSRGGRGDGAGEVHSGRGLGVGEASLRYAGLSTYPHLPFCLNQARCRRRHVSCVW